MNVKDFYTKDGTLSPAFPVKIRKEITQHFLPPDTRILEYADLYSQCEHDELGKFTVRSGYKPEFYDTTTEQKQYLTMYQVKGLPTLFISLSADRVKRAQAQFTLVPVANFHPRTDLSVFNAKKSKIVKQPGFYDITEEELVNIKTFL